ncbi:hypothetical protein Acsp04_18390 [Actinomadura sp. NBRC 104425]|nr:hypothetical protein Acsp04_18390 [Actinomadura sp. NBRC 104425]
MGEAREGERRQILGCRIPAVALDDERTGIGAHRKLSLSSGQQTAIGMQLGPLKPACPEPCSAYDRWSYYWQGQAGVRWQGRDAWMIGLKRRMRRIPTPGYDPSAPPRQALTRALLRQRRPG